MEEHASGRSLPHNPEAERALIGAMVLDSLRIPEIAEVCAPDDFFDRRHQILFETLLHLEEQNVPIDMISVAEALRATERFHEVGGVEYIAELGQAVTSSAFASHHATIVSEMATLRNLIREGTEMVSSAYETRPSGDAVKNLLDESEQRIYRIARQEESSGPSSISEAISETFQRIEASTGRGGVTGIPSGFMDLDQMTCGFNPGELIILAARPSMGKTALALNLTEHAALSSPELTNGRPPVVLFFSLEMGRQSLASRMLCTHAEVDAHRLRSGYLPTEDMQKLTDSAGVLQRAAIHIDDTSGISVMSLRSRARRLKARVGHLDMIIVDYLQLLSSPKAESRQQEISQISRALKGLARDMNLPVIALAQLSRAVESRDSKQPQLADLRESGSIEQDADLVMLLFRPEYYPQYQDDESKRGLAEVIIAKQRNGATGTVTLRFTPSTMRFNNHAPDIVEPISF